MREFAICLKLGIWQWYLKLMEKWLCVKILYAGNPPEKPAETIYLDLFALSSWIHKTHYNIRLIYPSE
ncbi:hypothetical protein COV21_03725 [Candidatus Woesearchaeota archaeon CG10_big_fil_rev_8_21_14_0_10_45_5]|nr:MAG: hypothetical protein COV21_03725 [Candidatus Woesearchaeota archaeon CG10_big_fil_rev_8_21_14_0_10_45_5]